MIRNLPWKTATSSSTTVLWGLGFLTPLFVVVAVLNVGQMEHTPPAAEHHAHIRSATGAALLQEMTRVLGGPQSADVLVATDAADLIEALDTAGVERALVLSIAYMFGNPRLEVADEYTKVMAENDYVAEQVATEPNRVIGACSVNPLADYALDEIERCARDPLLSALKLHFANSSVDLRDDAHVGRLARVFQTLGQHELPAVVHLRTGHPDYGAKDAQVFIDDVLSQAPRLPVQIAHMAGWGGYDAATDAALGTFVDALAAKRLDPALITFDLSAVVFHPAAAGSDTALARQVRNANRTLAARIREIGTESVVFATDWPSWPPTRDATLKIAQNAQLMEEVLPLTSAELAQVFANTNVIVRGRR